MQGFSFLCSDYYTEIAEQHRNDLEPGHSAEEGLCFYRRQLYIINKMCNINVLDKGLTWNNHFEKN